MSGWQMANNGVVATASGPQVILSGTPGLGAVDDNDFEISGTADAGWIFSSSGNLTRYSGTAYNAPEWFGRANETVHSTPDQTYYIRATTDIGDLPDSGTSLNVWFSLASTRSWWWTAGPGFDISTGTLKIEIARDSGGTDIVATGYYGGTATSEL